MRVGRDVLMSNFVFALNIFIAFLLLFEDKLLVPLWLQPFGRMHPLLLHFPIVLLLLAMAMECFRFKADNQKNHFYQRFTSALLLAGVITSGLTVTMGIFLSHEEGYAGAAVQSHKWWGASVFFIASAIYSWRDSRWYTATIARGGAVLVSFCLVMAGHFGGALTHGDNFILQPVLAETLKPVPLEEALVFDHVIKPVLEKKCTGCHNATKLKGELMLTDSVSIMKGGDTGQLFVAGDPDSSLLVKRILLPETEKEHMPPAGKPQLSEEERELLYYWIQSGARFNTRVVALDESDSLRIAATTVLTREEHVETFSFSAADPETLRKLNSNYRVLTPVAINSPALNVNIYNKDIYTGRMLDELKLVQEQVISLDLAKMPVRDEDVKYIARLENLRQLNLNFTEITDQALSELAQLSNLASLSLSGTEVNYAALLQFLPHSRSLQSLAIWDTPVSATEKEKLQMAFPHLAIQCGVNWDKRALIKLNPPKLRNTALIFDDSIAVELFHPVNGVDLRFSTDGTAPDSTTSPLFAKNIVLTESTEIKARAFKRGWLSSDVASLSVYKCRHKPDSAILLSRLNRVHTAKGAQTFFDHQLGSFNANSPAWANNWAGVIGNDLELLVKYDLPKKVRSVSLNTLIEPETFLFPPASIEVWGGVSEKDLKLIGRVTPELPSEYRKPFIRLIDCQFGEQEISVLKIVAKPVMKLPGWHKRKDKPALLLVDEILIN